MRTYDLELLKVSASKRKLLVSPYAFGNVFTHEEIQKIYEIASQFPVENGKTTDNAEKSSRSCEVSWLPTEDFLWIENRISDIVETSNSLWNFDIHGCGEKIQYTHYRNEGDHYSAHTDLGNEGFSGLRKISVVVFLNDDFEGGDLEIFTSDVPITVKAVKGNAVVFPSYLLHSVKPVTKGSRQTLVTWYHGPHFR